jgi:hypothetical protein
MGEVDENALTKYIIDKFHYTQEPDFISVCAESLFDRTLFPHLKPGGCMGESVTGGIEEDDYVQVMHQNCTTEKINEFCTGSTDFLPMMICFSKMYECAGYGALIRRECPYVYDIRTYGCDVENTDGLADLLEKYEEEKCKDISLDDVNYNSCGELSSGIYELCPEYITGDYEQW